MNTNAKWVKNVTVESENYCESVLETDQVLNKTIIKKLGLLLLKLEYIFNVSNTCIDELVEELHFHTASASGPGIKEIVLNTLKEHSCSFDDFVISELVKDLCQLNPFCTALGVDGPLSTQYRREQFIKEHLSLTEPVEYILDSRLEMVVDFRRTPPPYTPLTILNNTVSA
ncbi:hypothetical protein ILYODFUR_038873, partial [Ilyodon furcidens]